jgi:hypothetical protein
MKTPTLGRAVKASAWLGLICVALTGCATGTYKPVVRFGQLNLETQVPRQDLVILEAVEGTSREDAYAFGLVRIIDQTNWQVLGIKFFEDHCASPAGAMVPCCFIEPVSARAYYKALEKAPQADALIERSSTSSTRGFPFLYRMKEVTYRGKAIQLKTP